MTYTLALRPGAPALARPQLLLLKIEGEQIVDVEYRPDAGGGSPFARVERTGFEHLVEAAMHSCSTCGTAHALALCQAAEALAAITVPPRGAVLRVIAAELERATSHLRTAAAILTALDLPRPAAAFADHAQAVRAAHATLTGPVSERWLVPGGVAQAPDAETCSSLEQAAAGALEPLFALADRLITSRSLLARTVEVGVIAPGAAEQFGLAGPLARSAGLRADLRLDAPYAAYATFAPELVTQEGGDVYARLVLLILESLESLKLVERAARDLPAGPTRSPLPTSLPAGTGESAVEAPRGPLRYRVEADGRRLTAVSCRPAPQIDRLLARAALVHAAVDDSALVFISTDPCDSCLGALHN